MDSEKLKLRQGDILLYKPKGIFGHLIAVKTWHRISHVEIYAGEYHSFASRDGIGVDCYPVRVDDLAYVLRPRVKLNWIGGLTWFTRLKGTPYGWWDLLAFVGINGDHRGIVCSPFAAGFLRACGWDVFPEDPINKVAPFQFLDLIGRCCDVAYDFVGRKAQPGSHDAPPTAGQQEACQLGNPS